MPVNRGPLHTAKPLQTHGLYDEIWHPPRSRFVTYDHRDEHWMRPAGLGRIERRPVSLYDVRDEEDKLIGFTRYNPCENWPHMDLNLQDGSGVFSVRISVICYGASNGSDREEYDFWRAPLASAPALVQCRWIEVLGQDKLREFIRDLKHRLNERERQRMDMAYWMPTLSPHLAIRPLFS